MTNSSRTSDAFVGAVEKSNLPGAPIGQVLKLAENIGYQSIEYALAEIIDNSTDWGAKNIEIIFIEEKETRTDRGTWNISEVIIIDDGEGMNKESLEKALQITGSEAKFRRGEGKKGKFGFGLVFSSMYASKRLDVWSWQKWGSNKALRNWLDKDELSSDPEKGLIIPVEDSLPNYIQSITNIQLDSSGTAVRWSNLQLESQRWPKTAKTARSKSVFLLGRLFRYDLKENTNIRFKTYRKTGNGNELEMQDNPYELEVNDPLYLTENSSTPEPFNNKCLFELYSEEEREVKENGEIIGKYTIKASRVQKENLLSTVSDTQAGNTIWGKHAKDNRGVSIVREGRELFMDSRWYSDSTPQDRFWKIEVRFDQNLDDYFDVTTNKQDATHLRAAFTERLSTTNEAKKWKEKRDEHEFDLLRVAYDIADTVYILRKDMLKEVKGFRSSQHLTTAGEDPNGLPSLIDEIEAEASEAFRKWDEQRGAQRDKEFSEFTEQEKDSFVAKMSEEISESDGIEISKAKLKFTRIVDQGRELYVRTRHERAIRSFFVPERKKHNLIELMINTSHPFYDLAVGAVNRAQSEIDQSDFSSSDEIDELTERLRKAEKAILKLLAAWAYYEVQYEDEYLDELYRIRDDWSTKLKELLQHDVEQ